MKNRAGELKSNLSGEMTYQSFVPVPLPDGQGRKNEDLRLFCLSGHFEKRHLITLGGKAAAVRRGFS